MSAYAFALVISILALGKALVHVVSHPALRARSGGSLRSIGVVALAEIGCSLVYFGVGGWLTWTASSYVFDDSQLARTWWELVAVAALAAYGRSFNQMHFGLPESVDGLLIRPVSTITVSAIALLIQFFVWGVLGGTALWTLSALLLSPGGTSVSMLGILVIVGACVFFRLAMKLLTPPSLIFNWWRERRPVGAGMQHWVFVFTTVMMFITAGAVVGTVLWGLSVVVLQPGVVEWWHFAAFAGVLACGRALPHYFEDAVSTELARDYARQRKQPEPD